MEAYKPEHGRVVESKAGRDAGRYFIIYGIIDEQYVLTADGKYHKTAKPKKKKLKHLRLTADVNVVIGQKLIDGKKVFDSEISSALKSYNNKPEDNELCPKTITSKPKA